MRKLVQLILFLGLATSIQAQCYLCPKKEGFHADLCYTNVLFPKWCAQFAFDKEVFLFSRDEETIEVSTGIDGAAYYLKLAKDTNLNFSSTDIVFITEANRKWSQQKTALAISKGASMPLLKEGYKLLPSGLGVKKVHETNGIQAQAGRNVEVHYRGMLRDGTEFDSSFKRGKPIAFPLGRGMVIQGWEEGIAQLKVGEAAWFEIPPHLGYGEKGKGAIPDNATLYFYVVLVNVK